MVARQPHSTLRHTCLTLAQKVVCPLHGPLRWANGSPQWDGCVLVTCTRGMPSNSLVARPCRSASTAYLRDPRSHILCFSSRRIEVDWCLLPCGQYKYWPLLDMEAQASTVLVAYLSSGLLPRSVMSFAKLASIVALATAASGEHFSSIILSWSPVSNDVRSRRHQARHLRRRKHHSQ